MAQYARPNADTYRDNWVDDGEGTTNIYTTIDESSASDADYIQTVINPVDDVYVCALSTLTDPVSSSNHVVRYRYGKDAAGGNTIDLTVELRQGYVNEGSPGTLIKQWVHSDISDTLTTAQQTLSAGEADSITDYTDLYLRFVGDVP